MLLMERIFQLFVSTYTGPPVLPLVIREKSSRDDEENAIWSIVGTCRRDMGAPGSHLDNMIPGVLVHDNTTPFLRFLSVFDGSCITYLGGPEYAHEMFNRMSVLAGFIVPHKNNVKDLSKTRISPMAIKEDSATAKFCALCDDHGLQREYIASQLEPCIMYGCVTLRLKTSTEPDAKYAMLCALYIQFMYKMRIYSRLPAKKHGEYLLIPGDHDIIVKDPTGALIPLLQAAFEISSLTCGDTRLHSVGAQMDLSGTTIDSLVRAIGRSTKQCVEEYVTSEKYRTGRDHYRDLMLTRLDNVTKRLTTAIATLGCLPDPEQHSKKRMCSAEPELSKEELVEQIHKLRSLVKTSEFDVKFAQKEVDNVFQMQQQSYDRDNENVAQCIALFIAESSPDITIEAAAIAEPDE